MSTKELRYITLAQLIGCVLVILGHSYPFVTEYPEYVRDFRTFLYVFHMPLFVFCSGYLFSYTGQSTKYTFWSFTKNRALRLLVPYVSLSLIGVLPKILFSSVLNDKLGMDGMSLLRAFLVPRENIWGHFWFLPMIFFIGIIFYVVERYLFRGKSLSVKWGVLFLILCILAVFHRPIPGLQWLGINDICQFAWAYASGCLCFHLFGDIQQHFKASDTTIIVVSCLGIILISVIWFLFGRNLPELVGMGVKILIAILMIGSVLLLCLGLEQHSRISRQSLLGQTYQIYILSWPCQLVAEVLLERILHFQWWIIMPVVFATGVFLPLLLLRIIDWFERKTSTRFLSFILGKKSLVYE